MPAVRYDRRMAMPPFTLASLRRLRFARMALLWLALVMALAQTVAIGHASSHGPAETAGQSAGKHPGGLAHCQSCVAAAAFGGAPPPTPVLLLAATGRESPPAFAQPAQHTAPQQRPYAIRAPPVDLS